MVASKAALQLNPLAKIQPLQANIITDARFDVTWFRQFDLVMNALDNLEARRHVNRMCLAANVPLIESGTAGLLGQCTVHVPGQTECFDCTPKSKPTVFPVCTIRSTPSQPIHCIVWAKSYLFVQLFATAEETQLMQEQDESEENSKELENLRRESEALKVLRSSAGDSDKYVEQVFEKVFIKDVERLASNAATWVDRHTPNPLSLDLLKNVSQNTITEGISKDHQLWSLETCISVFSRSCAELGRRAITKVLDFDKDDDAMMDFVTSTSNMRAHIFSIQMQSRFDAKQMAGNIIPAVATSNAIVAGLEVLMALRLLAGDVSSIKTTILATNNETRLLTNETMQLPNPDCGVCSMKYYEAEVDVTEHSLSNFIDTVVRQHMQIDGDVTLMRGAGALIYDADFEDNVGKSLQSLNIRHSEYLTVVVDDDDNLTSVVYIAHRPSLQDIKVYEYNTAPRQVKKKRVIPTSDDMVIFDPKKPHLIQDDDDMMVITVL